MHARKMFASEPTAFVMSIVLFSLTTEIRLAGGSSTCSGRVEIFHNNEWGTVCDNSWDIIDAHVACQEVGCAEALTAPGGARFGQGAGPIWLDQVNCIGKEASLSLCPTSRPWGDNDCNHSKDAGVVCAGNNYGSVDILKRCEIMYSASCPKKVTKSKHW